MALTEGYTSDQVSERLRRKHSNFIDKPTEGVLDQLFIRPSAKGREIGTALLKRAMTEMPDRFWLRTADANGAACAFRDRLEPHPRLGHMTVICVWPGPRLRACACAGSSSRAGKGVGRGGPLLPGPACGSTRRTAPAYTSRLGERDAFLPRLSVPAARCGRSA